MPEDKPKKQESKPASGGSAAGGKPIDQKIKKPDTANPDPPQAEKKEKPSKEYGHPAKVSVLAVLTILVSIAAWHAWSVVFSIDTISDIREGLLKLIYVLVALCLFCALYSLSSLFIKRTWLVYLAGFLAALAPLIFFSVSALILVVPLLIFVGMIIYSMQIHYEIKSRIKFSPTLSIRHGLKMFMIFLSLAITIVYYINTTSLQRERGQEALDAMVDSAVNTANQVLSFKFTGYDPGKTVDDFLFDSMMKLTANFEEGLQLNQEPAQEEEQLENMLDELRRSIEAAEINEADLPEDVKKALAGESMDAAEIRDQLFEEVFREQVQNSRAGLADRLDIEINGDDLMSEVIAKVVRKYAWDYLGPYQQYITPLMALSLFLLLYGLGPVFRLIILLFSVILFGLFKVSKFVRIEKVNKEVDVLKL